MKMAEKMSFEQALEKLEGYAQTLSSPDVSLDESIKIYGESVKLIAQCQRMIERAKLKIEQVEAAPKEEEV